MSFGAKATHQRAAEITYRHIQGNTYEITVIMYTRTSSPADDTRDVMPIKWGDNTTEDIPRLVFQDLGNDITLNVYKGTHTFPGTGSYIISVEDPNRNNGVINIPNSVNVPMYVESLLVINPFLGPNNSVMLTNAPIDVGCVNKLFIHNPAAYDPDGDSLSYKLVICKGQDGMNIPGYSYPQASDFFILDEYTGDLMWKNPILQGEYNVAFIVEEWRAGTKIGYVRRDMQITIVVCDHDPPYFDPLPDTCVLAGDFITFPVKATDPEGTYVTLTAKGGPFYVPESPAIISPDPGGGTGSATTIFSWQTRCSHIRRDPYKAVFKATDDGIPVNLVNFGIANIKVISPPPENLTVSPLGRSISLNWDTIWCENATGYKIYRKESADNWSPGECETGVPSSTGYHLIKTLSGKSNSEYTDDNNGKGLNQGILYCYRVTATYYGTESIASEPACTYIKRDSPIITIVSNDSLNISAGKVWVEWSRPTELDTVAYPGPYEYHLFRTIGNDWDNQQEVAVFNSLNDTLYYDDNININKEEKYVNYRVDLHYLQGYLNSSDNASSIALSMHPYDKRLKISIITKVPWINEKFIVFRKDPDSTNFHITDTVYSNIFYDNNLENFKEYCYYVKAIGHYSLSGIKDPLINISQIKCAVPQDIEPPCKPLLTVETDCDNIENKLTWSVPYDSCNYDVAKYVIYYSANDPGNLKAIDSILNPYDTTYTDDNIEKVVGCYGVVAVDSVGNRSEMSDISCVNYDACPPCTLPNVFTPNNDNFNDLLVPLKKADATIDRIELFIFNRWGQKVYYTEDPEVKWDGRDMNSGKLLPDGTYYYKCKAYAITYDGEEITSETQGAIMLLSGN